MERRPKATRFSIIAAVGVDLLDYTVDLNPMNEAGPLSSWRAHPGEAA
jgi:hypothetical protein